MQAQGFRLVGVLATALAVLLSSGCGATSRAPASLTIPKSSPSPAPTTTGQSVAPATAPPTTFTTSLPTRKAPFSVVSATLRLVDDSRPTVSGGRQVAASRTLTTLVWRPAVAGRWPLVVFAHGFQVGPTPYLALLSSWAAAGFVVAAPEFPLTDATVAGANLDESDIDNQPADVRFVISRLVGSGSPLPGVIDPSEVALAGHSDGAETALAAAIAPPAPGQPSIRAVIAMGVSPLDGTSRTANPPLLVIQGDADTINPPALGLQTWDLAASPKYLVMLRGGGHLAPLEAPSPWLTDVERVTTDFLRAYLGGATAAATTTVLADGRSDPSRMTVQEG